MNSKNRFYVEDHSTWLIDHLLEENSIDQIDTKILKELFQDSRTSIQELANKCKISRPTVYERIKKLKQRGLIRKFQIEFDFEAAGMQLNAFILVSYNANKAPDSIKQAQVAKLLSRLKFVERVFIITGEYDFMVEVRITDMNTLSDLIIEGMREIPGVGNTITMISFDEYRGGLKQ